MAGTTSDFSGHAMFSIDPAEFENNVVVLVTGANA
jgi:hypothetical protein